MPKSDDRPELSQEALVEALVPDPSSGPPDATVLRGYLGRGSVEGTWRLYLTTALDDYVEIPGDKILHSHKLSEDRGTMVWVPKGLELRRKQITSEAVQAEFLAGSIEQGHLGISSAAAIAGIARQIGNFPSEFCPSRVVCPSFLPITCPSEVVIVCFPSADRIRCPSVTVACQSDLPRFPC